LNRLDFARPQEAMTVAEIAANVAAAPMPEGWTAADDVALMEGLFKDVGLMRIALRIRKPFDLVQARFVQLRRAACHHGAFTLQAQTRLLEVVRARV
jgi:hypothetical protein